MELKKGNRLLLLAMVGGYIFIGVSAILQNYSHSSICIFKNITGYPCPGCGITRGSILLFKGEILESILLNPAAIVVNIMALVAIVLIIRDSVKGTTLFQKLSTQKMNPYLLILLVVLVILNWIWNIYKGL